MLYGICFRVEVEGYVRGLAHALTQLRLHLSVVRVVFHVGSVQVDDVTPCAWHLLLMFVGVMVKMVCGHVEGRVCGEGCDSSNTMTGNMKSLRLVKKGV